MTIYEINKEMNELLDGSVDEATGELVMNMERLEELEISRKEKQKNAGMKLKNVRAEKKALQDEIENLKKRVKRCDATEDNIIKYLDYYFPNEDMHEVEVEMTHKVSTTTEVDDSFVGWAKTNNRDDLLRQKPMPEPEPDKMKIKKALDSGEVFEHAWLEKHNNLKVS